MASADGASPRRLYRVIYLPCSWVRITTGATFERKQGNRALRITGTVLIVLKGDSDLSDLSSFFFFAFGFLLWALLLWSDCFCVVSSISGNAILTYYYRRTNTAILVGLLTSCADWGRPIYHLRSPRLHWPLRHRRFCANERVFHLTLAPSIPKPISTAHLHFFYIPLLLQ